MLTHHNSSCHASVDVDGTTGYIDPQFQEQKKPQELQQAPCSSALSLETVG